MADWKASGGANVSHPAEKSSDDLLAVREQPLGSGLSST